MNKEQIASEGFQLKLLKALKDAVVQDYGRNDEGEYSEDRFDAEEALKSVTKLFISTPSIDSPYKSMNVLYLNESHLSKKSRLELEIMNSSDHIKVSDFSLLKKKEMQKAEVIIFSQSPYKSVLLKSRY